MNYGCLNLDFFPWPTVKKCIKSLKISQPQMGFAVFARKHIFKREAVADAERGRQISKPQINNEKLKIFRLAHFEKTGNGNRHK